MQRFLVLSRDEVWSEHEFLARIAQGPRREVPGGGIADFLNPDIQPGNDLKSCHFFDLVGAVVRRTDFRRRDLPWIRGQVFKRLSDFQCSAERSE